MDRDRIAVWIEGGVATVTLDRPDKRNAVSLAMWRRLAEVYGELRETARAALLTGAGEHFCAGADIAEFAEVRADLAGGQAYGEAVNAATIAIRDWPGPTIAAISGFAMGGGCGLALACDLRVADRTTRMGIPAAKLGIVYGILDCGLLHRQVGLANAKRVLYSGRPFPFDECVRMGLIDVPVETDALGAARALAAEFAANAPLSLQGSKTILEATAAGTADTVRDEVAALSRRSVESADYREGRRAFAEKRRPVFTGR